MKTKISYQLKRSKRAKRMRITVYHNGAVWVTSPFGAAIETIEKFIFNKTPWILKKIKFFKKAGYGAVRKFSRKDYLQNKDRALALARERVKYYNEIYGFSVNKIFIRNQKTRWGSCSSGGNLSFNYKILFLPERHRDYIIAHELCHLKELNHSPKFWKLVEKSMPDYLAIKKELRKPELFYK